MQNKSKKFQDDKLVVIGQMLVALMHDFRFPVQVILNAAHLMANTNDDDAKKKYLSQIQSHVKLFNRMIKSILDFTTGRISVLLQNVHSSSFADDLKESISYRFKDSQMKIEVVDNYKDKIYIDSEQLKRVFYNLLENSAKAMNYSGLVTIKFEKESSYLVILVKDTGPGISEEIQKKLFRPFISNEKEAGSGLGLTVSRQIITEHNGHIECKSKVGEGATFTITIPKITEPFEFGD